MQEHIGIGIVFFFSFSGPFLSILGIQKGVDSVSSDSTSWWMLLLPTLLHSEKKNREWVHDKDEMELHCNLYVCKSAFFFCLQQAAKEVSQALNNCVNFLPGQRDVDEAIKAVVDSSQSLAVEDVSALLASQVTS